MSDQSYASINVAQTGAPEPPAPVVAPPQTVMAPPPAPVTALPLAEGATPPRVFPPSGKVTALPPPPAPVATPQMMFMPVVPVVPVMAPPPPPAVVVIGGDFMKMDPLCEGAGMADCGACLLATYCPCMAVGEIAESIGMDECLACCSFASLCFFAGPACANSIHGCCLAQTFREQTGYNTNDNPCMTCLRHYITDGKSCAMAPALMCIPPLCCFNMPLACLMPPCSCALTQELRLARRIKAQQTTVVTTGPVRQMM